MSTMLPLFDKPSGFQPRDYQRQFLANYWRVMPNPRDTGLLVAATGLGKTEIAASIIEQEERTVMVSPFRETVGQTAERLRKRGLDVGVEMGSSVSYAQHTVACWPSLLSKRRFEKYVGCTSLLIVDEVHLNWTENSLMVMEALREGGAKVLGMTATPERDGNVIRDWFQNVVADYRIPQATRDGWLAPGKVWLTVAEGLDLSDFRAAYGGYGDLVAPKGGDPLESLMAREATVQCIASMIYQHHEGEPSLVFCAGKAQAKRLVQCLHDRGIVASIVHSGMDEAERRQHLRDFEDGRNNVIVNIGCLCVGYDFPPLRKVFMARPTANKNLYTQMIGRMTRPLAGVVDGLANAEERKAAIAASAKPFFEVFDFTDSSRRCDLLSAIDLLLDEDADVIERTKGEATKRGRALDKEEIDEIAEAERKAIAAEREAALAMEMRRRGGVISADFGVYGRDQFAAAEGVSKPKYKGWHILWGKYKGWPVPDAVAKDPQWVRWHMGKLHVKQEAYAAALLRELRKRHT